MLKMLKMLKRDGLKKGLGLLFGLSVCGFGGLLLGKYFTAHRSVVADNDQSALKNADKITMPVQGHGELKLPVSKTVESTSSPTTANHVAHEKASQPAANRQQQDYAELPVASIAMHSLKDEKVDYHWAASRENELRATVFEVQQQMGNPGLTINHLSCRTTACAIQVVAYEQPDDFFRALYQRLSVDETGSNLHAMLGETPNPADGKFIEMVISRKN